MIDIVLIYRILLANLLTSFYTPVVDITMRMEDLNNPPKPTAPVPLTLHSICIDPKHGQHKYARVNNVLLHYVESGNASKPLMIFVHGFPDYWYTWRHQILHYNKNYRVVAYDLRGFGDSDKPVSVAAYKKELLVEDLKGLIEHLGCKKATLVCHDWGGVVGSKMLEIYPDYVNGLVILSSVSYDVWNYAIWSSSEIRKRLGYMFLFRTCGVPERMLKRKNMTVLDQYFYISGSDTATKEDVECYKYWYGQEDAFTYAIHPYRANFGYTYSLAAQDIKVPFMCAIGTNDVALDTSLLDVMKSIYNNSEQAIVDDVGHFMHQEDPERVNTLMDNFFVKNNL